MKIGIDIRQAAGEKAGKGWYTFNLIYNLLEIDKENSYILYTSDPVPGFEKFPNAKQKIIKHSLIWHLKVARDAKKQNIEIFFSPTSYILPNFLSSEIKCIFTVHDLVSFIFPANHNKKASILEKIFLKRALKKAYQVIAISDNTKKDLVERFPTSYEKTTVIPCAAGDEFKPIKKQELTSFAEKTNLPENFFLAVGTLEPRKNYPTLIRAFAHVHHIFPDFHLIIVGKEGWNFEEVYEEIRKNYVNKNVHLLGYLSGKSLVNLYNLAKALIFPSFYEGFGIPPLEAMQSGCPVIASYSSSIPEVIGESGLLIDPTNEKDIAIAMTKIIKNKNLAEDLRNKGFVQSKKFSWESSAKSLLQLFA